ncbi:MAG: hypothetical protein OXC66_04465 [Roseovarius sp.]|nr:hypothetical protein [Roseovarius sp.]
MQVVAVWFYCGFTNFFGNFEAPHRGIAEYWLKTCFSAQIIHPATAVWLESSGIVPTPHHCISRLKHINKTIIDHPVPYQEKRNDKIN